MFVLHTTAGGSNATLQRPDGTTVAMSMEEMMTMLNEARPKPTVPIPVLQRKVVGLIGMLFQVLTLPRGVLGK